MSTACSTAAREPMEQSVVFSTSGSHEQEEVTVTVTELDYANGGADPLSPLPAAGRRRSPHAATAPRTRAPKTRRPAAKHAQQLVCGSWD